MLLSLFKVLLTLHGGFSPHGQYPPDYGPNLIDGQEFDFIVVGAGSAGSVIASRLSEISQWNVLLLEAGGYPSEMTEVPALSLTLLDSEEDWQYKLQPSDTCCLGLYSGYCKCPTGKGVGGSSLINYMLYTRSTKHDHDRWLHQGNEGWDHDSIVKYYKKFENVSMENNSLYGTNGELRITQYTSTQPARQILMNAYQELGLGHYTEDKPVGFRDSLQSVYQGTRQTSAKAFLTPAKDRKNLYLATNAHVSKVLVDPDTLTAYGVEVQVQNQLLKLIAKKEVVISSGSIGSPQILMRSGIGPEEHLAEVGIKTIKNLRVGENYQDHPAFPLVTVRIDPSAAVAPSSLQLVNEMYQYILHRTGILAEIDITNFCNYINTKNETNFSNVQILHILVHQHDSYFSTRGLSSTGIPKEVIKTVMEYNKNSPYIIFFPVLLHPKSTGSVRLQNADAFGKPLITPNFLNDKDGEDIETLLNAIKFIKKLTQTKTLGSYNPEIIDLNIKNCDEFEQQSDDFWRCAIRNIGLAVYHPVGTCKMGPANDSAAVVDPQLRVYGVKNLRVADASIIPMTTSCNTNAPTMMIGEKAADLIKHNWITKHDEL